jgi:hypothetical protein
MAFPSSVLASCSYIQICHAYHCQSKPMLLPYLLGNLHLRPLQLFVSYKATATKVSADHGAVVMLHHPPPLDQINDKRQAPSTGTTGSRGNAQLGTHIDIHNQSTAMISLLPAHGEITPVVQVPSTRERTHTLHHSESARPNTKQHVRRYDTSTTATPHWRSTTPPTRLKPQPQGVGFHPKPLTLDGLSVRGFCPWGSGAGVCGV